MFLGQKSNRGRFFQCDLPFIRRGLAQDQRKQGGLSRAIRPDKPDAIAPIYLQRRIFKENASAKGLRDLRNGKHAGGGECREYDRTRKLRGSERWIDSRACG